MQNDRKTARALCALIAAIAVASPALAGAGSPDEATAATPSEAGVERTAPAERSFEAAVKLGSARLGYQSVGIRARQLGLGGAVVRVTRLGKRPARVRQATRALDRRVGRETRQRRRYGDLPATAFTSDSVLGVPRTTLEAIAACESGGDPQAVNPAGYYGKYQFDTGTWASVGGAGNPADASEAEQDYRAATLYRRSGASPWPVCGL